MDSALPIAKWGGWISSRAFFTCSIFRLLYTTIPRIRKRITRARRNKKLATTAIAAIVEESVLLLASPGLEVSVVFVSSRSSVLPFLVNGLCVGIGVVWIRLDIYVIVGGLVITLPSGETVDTIYIQRSMTETNTYLRQHLGGEMLLLALEDLTVVLYHWKMAVESS